MKFILALLLLVITIQVDAQQSLQLTRIKNNKVTNILPGDPFTFSFLDSTGDARGVHATLVSVNDSMFTFRVGMIDEMRARFYSMPINKIVSIRKEGAYVYNKNMTMLLVTMLEVIPTVEFIINNTANTTQALLWAIPAGVVLGVTNGLIESAFWPTKPRRKVGEYYKISVVGQP